ncbi:MAG TPA: putative peptidoglycan glycosyltransferase FtsW [Alphaproteobacteria bacterium]|nr:putative peptidoglycan glycosyltransferase FtsW [Alphaproteobacteria bacterium]
MVALARTDTSVLGRWWWTVDRWTLAAFALLSGFGAILVAAASPPVAARIGLDEFYFVERHVVYLAASLVIMAATSLLTPVGVRRLALLMLAGGVVGLAGTLVVGVEIKGATRWIQLPGLSVQPSEFVKPAFAVVAAWLFAQQKMKAGFPGNLTSTALFGLILALLLAQPDLGMAVVVTAVWGTQFFLAGLPMLLVVILAVLAVGGMVGSYFAFSHVASRIDRFLDPSSGDSYQINRSLEAFRNGGVWGTGPGQGTVKLYLPDAHADFVFAVAGEEFGLLWCIVLVALFAFIVLRGFARLNDDSNLFVLLAGAGLLVQFGLQALINMGSTLHLIPTKGMTLPFVSYGGSSLIALGFGMGMMLALTRRRPGMGAVP